MIKAGKGYVFDGQGNLEALLPLIAYCGNLKALNPDYPPRLTDVVLLEVASEDVLVSQLKDGIPLFIKWERAVTTALVYQPGNLKPVYEKIPPEITLPALAFRWVDGKTGEVT
jgi:hypothetical protein